jgi:hypothetical protein
MTVWLIYEMRNPADIVVAVCASEKVAERVCKKRNRTYPHSDGFYFEAFDVIE